MSPLPPPAVAHALDAHVAAPADRSNAHLADYSFRFDVSAPTGPAPRPTADAPGETWTLAQTLQEIRIRQTNIARTTRGLRVRHAHRVSALAAAVARHAAAVELWLALGRPEPSRGWDDEVALQRAWFRDRLAGDAAALALRPGVTVTDPARFFASVEGRFSEGPDAPTADGLRRDLADLFDRHARPALTPVTTRRPARAA